MTDVEPSELQSLLEAMPLPARRDEVVDHAEIEGADDDLLAALRALPDREYETMDDVGETLRAAQT